MPDVSHDCNWIQRSEYRLGSGRRHLRIQYHIEVSTVDNSHVRRHALRLLIQQHSHRLISHTAGLLIYPRTDLPGKPLHLTICESAFLICNCQLVWIF